MSLLEDLQTEVKKIRAEELQHNAEREAQQKFYDSELHPVMLRVYEYFLEIVENLNIVNPEINANYPLNPLLERGVNLQQSQYKFRADNRESPHQVDIYCRCTLEKKHEFYVSSREAAQAHVDLLDSYNIHYHCKHRLDRNHEIRGATFILEGPMVAHLRVATNLADRNILIVLRNLGDKPVKRYKLSPDSVNDVLLERLARILLREVSQLTEVTIDERFREQLRLQVDLDKHRKERDLAKAYEERELAQIEEKNSSLVNRSKRALVEQARGLMKKVYDGKGQM